MPVENILLRAQPVDPQRYREGQRATWISAALNLVLTTAQLIVGWSAHSQSLVAHGLHSFSDLLSDFLVLWANRTGSHPADSEHPYGHARVETAATLVLGASLSLIGFAILWEATMRLQHIEAVPAVEAMALWMALATAISKEALFRYLSRVAERLRSPMLAANAWHTRADAASALVVVAGIGGSLLGWKFLDLLAAATMGFMILRMGLKLAWQALRELVDTGLDAQQVEAIGATLREAPGVLGLHDLRTRRMAHQALVDAHVLVDSRISVSEGHRIGESARQRVLRAHPEVMDVLVHVDAEEDVGPIPNSAELPDRETLLRHLRALLGEGLPEFDKTQLHYLGSRVEAEIFLPREVCFDAAHVAALERRIAERLPQSPIFSAVSINCRIAPRWGTRSG